MWKMEKGNKEQKLLVVVSWCFGHLCARANLRTSGSLAQPLLTWPVLWLMWPSMVVHSISTQLEAGELGKSHEGLFLWKSWAAVGQRLSSLLSLLALPQAQRVLTDRLS